MHCPNVPALETPPGETASAKYVVVVDVNGDTKVLIRPDNKSLLYFDGNDAYWADGGVSFPITLPMIVDNNKDETDTLNGGVAVFNSVGTLFSLVNESPDKMFLTSESGTLKFEELGGPEEEQLLPETGNGVLVRPPAGDAVWISDEGLLYTNALGVSGSLANGTTSQYLKMDVSGQPVWANFPSGSVSSGNASMGLDGVEAASVSVSQVNVKAPTFTLTDGVNTVVVTNVNVTCDLTDPVGDLNALDTGAEGNNLWYYVHIVSDGVNVDSLISLDPAVPDFGSTGYTYSALASLFRNDSGGNIRAFIQKGRKFNTENVVMSADIAITTAFNAITQSTALNTILPPMVKLCGGMAGGAATASNNRKMSVASTITGLGTQIIDANAFGGLYEGFAQNAGNFQDMPIADPAAPALYWHALTNDAHRRILFNSYTI